MEDALVRMMVLAPKKSFSASQSSRMKLVVNSGRNSMIWSSVSSEYSGSDVVTMNWL